MSEQERRLLLKDVKTQAQLDKYLIVAYRLGKSIGYTYATLTLAVVAICVAIVVNVL